MCHTVGGTGIAQPVDGLHDNTPLPTVSGVAHDESFPTGAHMANGTWPNDTAANGTGDFYVFTAYSDGNTRRARAAW